ncbi:type II toxin-antitoxin system VapC family toxin [Dolichospermum sp. LEGE 00240]|uniref:type II toxin-antitoxin system VapC family toxin n=1 Tax=Dolichospermum sp. LEGE 00240 TaxID=1828603 RepID=UPI00187F3923|nr:type II toxin-antitoxin system VapC family toxin [Dolichospermum sp. LEGE 00240]MBE9251065.1 type II toxin-antitoxin system VapC family toxin [Dolichospermum sp. LEGE 00240]MDM3845487.1 type II toxin-antitoxin system VapC family toxin [Aphanizomenon gracile PMC638.10]
MSQIIVLDTHIWFWFINQQFDKFSTHWREAIETADEVGICVISCYEIALAQQRGRLELPCTANQWCQEALEPSGITLFPLTAEIACRAVNLSAVHKDPFDRLIIATTLEYQAKLASIDGLFSQYPELNNYLMK